VIPARPDKWRGAYVGLEAAAVALQFSCLLYQPPASGARVTLSGASAAHFVGVVNASQILALGFAVAGVNSLNIMPTWGADYAPTGTAQGGTLVTSQSGQGAARGANTVLESYMWEVFQPNAFLISNSTNAVGGTFYMAFAEYPSAEELNRWKNRPA